MSARWTQGEIDFVTDALVDGEQDAAGLGGGSQRWDFHDNNNDDDVAVGSPEPTPTDFLAAAEALSGDPPAVPSSPLPGTLSSCESIDSVAMLMNDNEETALLKAQDSFSDLLGRGGSLADLDMVPLHNVVQLDAHASMKRTLSDVMRSSEDSHSDEETLAPPSPGGAQHITSSGPASVASNSGRGGGSKTLRLSLEQSLSVFHEVGANLQLNSRKERDWGSLYKRFTGQHPLWAQALFPKVCLFKQKCKLLFRERRLRAQMDFWKQLRRVVDVEAPHDDADAVQRVLASLTRKVSAGAPRTLPSAAASWDLLSIAEFLVARARSGETGPGGILDWPQPARDAILAAMLQLHRHDSGSGFAAPHRPFECLVVRAEAELALVASCECSGCGAWGARAALGSGQTRCTSRARLAWTRARAALMHTALELHEMVDPVQQAQFAEACREQQPALADWSDAAVGDFLHEAHSTQACDTCSSRKKRARGGSRRAASPVQCVAGEGVLSLDALMDEVEALEEEYDCDEELEEEDDEEDALATRLSRVAIQ